MAKVMRKCVICGGDYSYCPRCGEDAGKPTWYFTFCSENCKDIYNVCTDWRDGNISKEKASEEIKKLDISKLDNFAKSTEAQIDELLAVKKVEPISEKKPSNNVNKNKK